MLGSWIVRQRSNRDTLSIERKTRLDALGFDWGPMAIYWDEGFRYLKMYMGCCELQVRDTGVLAAPAITANVTKQATIR
jgi:hypothetical protein